jgi:hypothetical protein
MNIVLQFAIKNLCIKKFLKFRWVMHIKCNIICFINIASFVKKTEILNILQG